jgi:aspartate/methionine/tyrosine aminotransferase
MTVTKLFYLPYGFLIFEISKLSGGSCNPVPTSIRNFKTTPEQLEAAITPSSGLTHLDLFTTVKS